MTPKRLKIKDYRVTLNDRHIRGNARLLAEAICKHPGLTARELVEVVGLPVNIVSGRAADLKGVGLITCCGVKEHTPGHKSARLYAAIPALDKTVMIQRGEIIIDPKTLGVLSGYGSKVKSA